VRRYLQESEVQVSLKALRPLVARGQYDVRPAYVIVAGMLFQPLSLEYLQSWGGVRRFLKTYYRR
jgi:hypothetical protein